MSSSWHQVASWFCTLLEISKHPMWEPPCKSLRGYTLQGPFLTPYWCLWFPVRAIQLLTLLLFSLKTYLAENVSAASYTWGYREQLKWGQRHTSSLSWQLQPSTAIACPRYFYNLKEAKAVAWEGRPQKRHTSYQLNNYFNNCYHVSNSFDLYFKISDAVRRDRLQGKL